MMLILNLACLVTWLAFPLTSNAGKVGLTGVNLPGLAFDMSIFGSAFSKFESSNCNASYAAYSSVDPPGHYEEWWQAGMNAFRIPFGWQHIQQSLGGPLNTTTLVSLDRLVDQITSNGSVAILDLHNYGRWYCSIVGQHQNSFPPGKDVVLDNHLADVWAKLARHFANNTRVLFELMNEPHDLDISSWKTTMQTVITAIRKVTSKQTILIPGTQYARLSDWKASSEASIGPGHLYDPANKLMWDFHQYFDDTQGAVGFCQDWEASFLPSFYAVTKHLRHQHATAALTEFGANGLFPQCVTLFDKLLQFMDDNNDVWKLWTAWGAYNPGSNYLTLSPGQGYPLVQKLKEHGARK